MGAIRWRAGLGGLVLCAGACAPGDTAEPADARPVPDAFGFPDARPTPDAIGFPDAAPVPDAFVPPDATPRVCGDGVRAPGEVCFGAPLVIDAGDYVFSARLADVDGDGVRDLIWLARDRVVIRRGDGHGAFAAAVDGPATASDVLAVGDLDLDGVPDLVAAGRDAMTVWLGQGGGAFGAPITTPLGEPASGLAVADFDGYPGDEIALGTNSVLQVYRVSSATSVALEGQAYVDVLRVHARDVDGDYKADAIVTFPDGLIEYPGEADGVSNSYADLHGGVFADATYGDLDGDTIADAVIAQPSPPAIVTRRAGDVAWNVHDVSAQGAPQFVDTADLDGDGTADVIAGLPAATSIAALASAADGSLTPAATVALPDRMTELHADGDVNGDGLADLAITLPTQIVVVETAAP